MIFVYNTLSRSKEEFRPIHGKRVSMFVCGQTVYDDAHLGHAKNYINFDVVARWLRHSGYTLKYVQNITDVDDKIIKKAEEEGVDPIELARKFEARFMEDMEAIGVKKNVDQYPRSHDYIEEMRSQIQLLMDKGYAYRIDNDIYYDVSKFSDYTRLSGMRIEELERHRIEPREGKRNGYDFALWKGAREVRAELGDRADSGRQEGEIQRKARLAHRGHRDNSCDLREAVRPSWRRDRAHIPAPHQRDSAGRGRIRGEAIRQVLDAFRNNADKGREDVKEPEELHTHKSCSRGSTRSLSG